MRRIISAFILILLTVPSIVLSAQSSELRIFNPPTSKVEISGEEPLPPGVAELVFYGVPAGGGGGLPENPAKPRPYWTKVPSIVHPAGRMNFTACGYQDDVAPKAIIDQPNGYTASLPKKFLVSEGKGCWSIDLSLNTPVLLGPYKIHLEHSHGNLNYVFGVELPFCPVVNNKLNRDNADYAQNWVLTGFEPQQLVTLLVYRDADAENIERPNEALVTQARRFVASRLLQIDKDGTLKIDISLSRSAPFTLAGSSIVILSTQQEMLYPSVGSAIGQIAPQMVGKLDYVTPLWPKPRYTTYGIIGNGTEVNWFLNDVNIKDHYCDNVLMSPIGQHRTLAHLETLNNSPQPVYESTRDQSQIGVVNSGIPVIVTEQEVGMSDNRAFIWSRIMTEDGLEAWIQGQQLFPVSANPVAGGQAYLGNQLVRLVSTQNSYTWVVEGKLGDQQVVYLDALQLLPWAPVNQ
jgi:hypothetical protein